jgi:hypothetical protein
MRLCSVLGLDLGLDLVGDGIKIGIPTINLMSITITITII